MYIKRFVTVAINSLLLLSLQMFLPDECRCRCPNVAEKEECERHASGKKWDPVFCRCFCPSSTFAICEENQVYDFRNECRYVCPFKKLVHYCSITLCSQCLKIIEKVSFNFASEASKVFILSGQKLIKNAENGSQFDEFLTT